MDFTASSVSKKTPCWSLWFRIISNITTFWADYSDYYHTCMFASRIMATPSTSTSLTWPTPENAATGCTLDDSIKPNKSISSAIEWRYCKKNVTQLKGRDFPISKTILYYSIHCCLSCACLRRFADNWIGIGVSVCTSRVSPVVWYGWYCIVLYEIVFMAYHWLDNSILLRIHAQSAASGCPF